MVGLQDIKEQSKHDSPKLARRKSEQDPPTLQLKSRVIKKSIYLLDLLKKDHVKEQSKHDSPKLARRLHFLLTPGLNIYQPFLIPSPTLDLFEVTLSSPCSHSSAFPIHW